MEMAAGLCSPLWDAKPRASVLEGEKPWQGPLLHPEPLVELLDGIPVESRSDAL